VGCWNSPYSIAGFISGRGITGVALLVLAVVEEELAKVKNDLG
jgi:hypothetical protein